MVNADKHKALKVFNEITAQERLIRQVKNRKKNYNKIKFKAHAEAKYAGILCSNLEALLYRI